MIHLFVYLFYVSIVCYLCRADTLLGVQSLVRTNNRTKKQTLYGYSKTSLYVPEKFMSESEIYFFFVHGDDMQLWVNAGNEATLLEWMVGG